MVRSAAKPRVSNHEATLWQPSPLCCFLHLRLPRVRRFPHHAFSPLAAQQLDRVVVVDVAELSLVDAVAAYFLQAPRKALCGLLRNAELQILLLPHPVPAIGAGECKAPLIGVVG